MFVTSVAHWYLGRLSLLGMHFFPQECALRIVSNHFSIQQSMSAESKGVEDSNNIPRTLKSTLCCSPTKVSDGHTQNLILFPHAVFPQLGVSASTQRVVAMEFDGAAKSMWK